MTDEQDAIAAANDYLDMHGKDLLTAESYDAADAYWHIRKLVVLLEKYSA